MLQDLSFGKLENEFHNISPSGEDMALCFSGADILVRKSEDGTFSFPTVSQTLCWQETRKWDRRNRETLRYIFRMQDKNYFLWMGSCGAGGDGFALEKVRCLRDMNSRDNCFAAMTGWHLYNWYRNNRFCGSCGSLTEHDTKERMLRCPKCGQMIFPRISPAVIVAVTDGDRLLLSKYAGRSFTRFALLAGYTEIGETLEQTVQREVMEEVGLRVKNLRYYKSQPWGVDGNILMGFFCDLDGSDEIRIDPRELSMAEWYFRDRIPAKDDGFSLTREMIRVFSQGKEPK